MSILKQHISFYGTPRYWVDLWLWLILDRHLETNLRCFPLRIFYSYFLKPCLFLKLGNFFFSFCVARCLSHLNCSFHIVKTCGSNHVNIHVVRVQQTEFLCFWWFTMEMVPSLFDVSVSHYISVSVLIVQMEVLSKFLFESQFVSLNYFSA